MLLAIDTSAGTSVAVVDRDRATAAYRVLAETGTADTMRHAEAIGVAIRDALSRASVAPRGLSGVVAGMGPGPFTGLRVGIAAAKAFALGAGVPLVPVVSHDGVAAERYAAGHEGPLLVVTDARRREVYWSAYSGLDDQGVPVRVDGPGLCRPDALPHPGLPRFDAVVVSAAHLGLLAERLHAHGRPFAADRPLYLRSPDVTPSAGPKRVSA